MLSAIIFDFDGVIADTEPLHYEGLRRTLADMDRLIADRSGRLAFGSLVRCTVERWDEAKATWPGTGGGTRTENSALRIAPSRSSSAIALP